MTNVNFGDAATFEQSGCAGRRFARAGNHCIDNRAVVAVGAQYEPAQGEIGREGLPLRIGLALLRVDENRPDLRVWSPIRQRLVREQNEVRRFPLDSKTNATRSKLPSNAQFVPETISHGGTRFARDVFGDWNVA